MSKILFDFDGTLAFHPGLWSQCLVDVLDGLWPGHRCITGDFRRHLRDSFPWHRPEDEHLHLSTTDEWWRNMEPHFRRSFLAVGTPDGIAEEAVAAIRPHYCDPARFQLFPDTAQALTTLKQMGLGRVVLSNHVPELPSIIDGLGIGELIDEVFSSATIGYEKPHPEAFRIALGGARPAKCFMVGDNLQADVLGAERVGLPAILVRNESREVKRVAADLEGAIQQIFATRARLGKPSIPTS